MNQQNIQMFIMSNQKKFDAAKLPIIEEKLENMEDGKYLLISSGDYKDPTMMLLISLFLGGLGIDRFMLGDTGIGVLKLLTGGCFGVLTIIDWCTIMEKTKERNFKIFIEASESLFLQNQTLQGNKRNSSDDSEIIEEIKKYKELFDSGVITKEDFENKKKELLNL